MFQFEILHKSKKSNARVGRVHTPHGIIETPNFVPVGTHGTIKAIDSVTIDQMDVQLIFCNTYHMLLHPGPDVVRKAGGLHRFINRKQPIITDSGGFQVFSLGRASPTQELKSRRNSSSEGSIIKVTEEGVKFRSYRDGAIVMLTPEYSVQVQKALGADIIVPLDELLPTVVAPQRLKQAFDRTHRWEDRSLQEHLKNPQQQAMYGIVHGAIDPELRRMSCEFLRQRPFDGFAIGGSFGETRQEMFQMLSDMLPFLPIEKPRHLLGIGDLPSLELCMPLGIDTFDSSYPTRAARHATLLSKEGNIKIDQKMYREAYRPVEKDCSCSTCKNYTLAYIHHLFKAKELVGLTLATIHNVHFMMQLMQHYRQQIIGDKI